jgi:hypothetical protein
LIIAGDGHHSRRQSIIEAMVDDPGDTREPAYRTQYGEQRGRTLRNPAGLVG